MTPDDLEAFLAKRLDEADVEYLRTKSKFIASEIESSSQSVGQAIRFYRERDRTELRIEPWGSGTTGILWEVRRRE